MNWDIAIATFGIITGGAFLWLIGFIHGMHVGGKASAKAWREQIERATGKWQSNNEALMAAQKQYHQGVRRQFSGE